MQEHLQGFISYKRENQNFAENLYQALTDWGFLPWLDVKKLDAGYQPELRSGGWSQQITQAINASCFMIAIITPKSLESAVVQAEWFAAWHKNIPIFFLRLEPFDSSLMDILFLRHQYIDCVDNSARGIEKLKTTLLNFREGRQTLSEELSTDRIGSLNTEILDDLDKLVEASPTKSRVAFGKKDKLIGSAIPTDADTLELRDRVRRYWFEGSLRPSLEEAHALNINLSIQVDAVIEHEDLGNFELKGSMDVHKAYRELQNFLILGEAGAGKTVMLLQLATKLMRHEKHNIPLVLNLSSWGNDPIPLEDWLVKEAETTYQVRAAIFRRWLEDKRLILLLDGLDEIKEEVRAERIQRINTFRKANERIPIVLCSRIAEYRLTTEDKAEKKLDFPHALRLEALSKAQIETYLSQPDFAVVKALYEKDEIVQDLAQNPFLLTSMAYTYKGEGLKPLEIKENNNRFSRIKHLFERYISLKLKSNEPLRYSEEKVKESLTWIAVKTTAYGTVFRPEEITIDWFKDDEELLEAYEFWKMFSLSKLAKPILEFIYRKIPWKLDEWDWLERYSIWELIEPLFLSKFIKRKLLSTKYQFIFDMITRQIMRPMGGGYLFRHDYLRQSLLGTTPAKAQVQLLIQDIMDGNYSETAIKGLVAFGEIAIFSLLNALLTDRSTYNDRFDPDEKDRIARINLTIAIIEVGRAGIDHLITALSERDKAVRSLAASVLGLIEDRQAVEPLINALKDESHLVRGDAADALGRLHDIRAVEPLIVALADTNSEVRENAAEALAELGDVRAFKALKVVLNNEHEESCYSVKHALIRLIRYMPLEPLLEILNTEEDELRYYIMSQLANLADSRAVEPLIATLNDTNSNIRYYAAKTLRQIGTPEALQALKDARIDE